MIVKAENVLEPKVLKEILNLRKKIQNINEEGLTWEDVCFRIPIVTKTKCFESLTKQAKKRKKRSLNSSESEDDWNSEDWDDWEGADDDLGVDDLNIQSGNITDEIDAVSDSCDTFKMPSMVDLLSKHSFTALTSLKARIESQGLTKEIGNYFIGVLD